MLEPCNAKVLRTVLRGQPTLDLASQNPVLRRKIFVSQQEFLIDCSGDIGEQARPEHLGLPRNLKLRKR